jgi:hypothetical protein
VRLSAGLAHNSNESATPNAFIINSQKYPKIVCKDGQKNSGYATPACMTCLKRLAAGCCLLATTGSSNVV